MWMKCVGIINHKVKWQLLFQMSETKPYSVTLLILCRILRIQIHVGLTKPLLYFFLLAEQTDCRFKNVISIMLIMSFEWRNDLFLRRDKILNPMKFVKLLDG